jgi:hypothetical protein
VGKYHYNTLNSKVHQSKTESCTFCYNDLFDFLTCFSVCELLRGFHCHSSIYARLYVV